MLPFQSKMHQNRWRLGLRPRPRWGAHSAAPDLLDLMGYWYEICEFTELLGLPGCVPDLTGNNIISFAIILEYSKFFQKIVIYIAPNASFLV